MQRPHKNPRFLFPKTGNRNSIKRIPLDPFGSLYFWSMRVWLTIEILSALYLISFAWFWSICRLSIPRAMQVDQKRRKSNLIPFERGANLPARRKTGT